MSLAGTTVIGMHLLSSDLTATYANILIVLLLTFVVDQRLGSFKASSARRQAARWYRAIVTVDAVVLGVLFLSLEHGAYAFVGFIAQVAMAVSVGFLAGSYLGFTQQLVDHKGKHETAATR